MKFTIKKSTTSTTFSSTTTTPPVSKGTGSVGIQSNTTATPLGAGTSGGSRDDDADLLARVFNTSEDDNTTTQVGAPAHSPFFSTKAADVSTGFHCFSASPIPSFTSSSFPSVGSALSVNSKIKNKEEETASLLRELGSGDVKEKEDKDHELEGMEGGEEDDHDDDDDDDVEEEDELQRLRRNTGRLLQRGGKESIIRLGYVEGKDNRNVKNKIPSSTAGISTRSIGGDGTSEGVKPSGPSKYILKLLTTAKRREMEKEIVEERKLKNERDQEGVEFKDKEQFITSGYKRKLEERKQIEKELKLKEMSEQIKDVKKKKDLTDFHLYLLNSGMGSRSLSTMLDKAKAAVAPTTNNNSSSSSTTTTTTPLTSNVDDNTTTTLLPAAAPAAAAMSQVP